MPLNFFNGENNTELNGTLAYGGTAWDKGLGVAEMTNAQLESFCDDKNSSEDKLRTLILDKVPGMKTTINDKKNVLWVVRGLHQQQRVRDVAKLNRPNDNTLVTHATIKFAGSLYHVYFDASGICQGSTEGPFKESGADGWSQK